MAMAVAALEAGLEDLVLAGHGRRQGAEGQAMIAGVNSVDKNPRHWLVERRLMAPNRRKVEQVLFADFGVLLDGLIPRSARFELRRKDWSKGGSGRGTPIAGPTDWNGLAALLETMSHIRNATAHGDSKKLGAKPSQSMGDLWLIRADGNWSVQLPHALNALRAVLAIFNRVAEALADSLAVTPRPALTPPDTISYEAP